MAILREEPYYRPEDLLAMPDGDRLELVDGRLVERPNGFASSLVGGRLFYLLSAFNDRARLGSLVPAGASYQCFDDPLKVRRPDVSFVRNGRFLGGVLPRGHSPIAPDLAVEVISPNDLYSEVRTKVEEYLGAGVGLVWVIDPTPARWTSGRPPAWSGRSTRRTS